MAPMPWISSHARTQSPQRMHLLGSRTSDGDERVDRLRLVGRLEPHPLHAQPPREPLQFAGRALGAGGAALLVVGQDQLQGDLPHLADLFGVGADLQARLRRRRTTGHDAASFDVHQAQPAGAVDAQLRMVAEGGDVDAGLAGHVQEIALAVDGHRDVVDREGRFGFHRIWSWFGDRRRVNWHALAFTSHAHDRVELAGRGAGAALDALFGVDVVRLLALAVDGAHRALPAADRAALAQVGKDLRPGQGLARPAGQRF